MEVLKNLSEKELSSLRETFFAARDHALTLDEFEVVLTAACASKPHISIEKLHLRELFNDIDVNGDDTVSWDEFTMFLITSAMRETAFEEDGGDIKRYNHAGTITDVEIPNSIQECRYLPKLDSVLKIMRRRKTSRLKLCNTSLHMQTTLTVPRSTDAAILAAEHIPLCNDVARSATVAVSYSDSVLRFFETRQSTLPGAELHEMPLVKETRLLESQTVLRWSNRYHRLVAGSRTGVVSVLDVDQAAVFSKEKLHNLLVSSMILRDTLLFTGSVDRINSVKCVDLERSVVRFALNGGGGNESANAEEQRDSHFQGVNMIALSDYHSQLFTAGFELYVLAYSTALPRLKPYVLDDPHRPHRGRIVGLESVPGSPQIITADSAGLVKVWDLRMYTCVQSITPSKDDGADILSSGRVTSIGFIPPQRRLVVNGRDTTLYEYDEAGSPLLSDDRFCTVALYNAMSHTFLTVHNRTLKLWDAATGMLRSTHSNALPEDISCVCIATPLGRRFFAGTRDGTLFSFAYAMCTVQREYERFFSAATSEIVCLVYMETFRDSDHQYVAVGLRQEVALVPDADEHVQRSVLSLHCFDSVLTDNRYVASVGVSHGSYVIVGTTDGTMHVADLTNFSLMLSWRHDSLRGELPCIRVFDAFSQVSSVIFVSDASGRVGCILAATASKWQLLHEWEATSHTPSAQLMSEELAGAEPIQLRGGVAASDPAVSSYFNQDRLDLFTPQVTAIACVEAHCLLLTGDDRGYISLWDVSHLLFSAFGELRGGAAGRPEVRLIHHWRAHDDEIVSLSCFERNNVIIVLSAAHDKRVSLWSLDGESLGTLAQGRNCHDSQHCGGSFTVDSPPVDSGSQFRAYEPLVRLPSGSLTAEDIFSSSTSVREHVQSHGASATFMTDGSQIERRPRAPAPLDNTQRMPVRLRGLLKKEHFAPSGTSRSYRATSAAPLSHTVLPELTPRSGRTAPRGPPAKEGPQQFLRHLTPRRSDLGRGPDFAASNSVVLPRLQSPRDHRGDGRAQKCEDSGTGNPFETMREYALRTKGSVVLGTHTEASNRVI